MNLFFAAGDAPFFFFEQIREFTLQPSLWRSTEGLGTSTISFHWIDYPFRIVTLLLTKIGLSWFIIDKLWWISIFLLAIIGSYQLSKKLKIPSSFSYISSLIYSSNTYFLLMFDGGQLGVALSYSLLPLVLFSFFQIFERNKKPSLRAIAKNSLLLSIFIFTDIRIAFASLLCAVPFLFLQLIRKKIFISKRMILIPIIVIVINFYWIYPSLLYSANVTNLISQNTTSADGLSFYSVADFSHAISLLHPNYPENLFGKVYFLKSEFLILPILAFSFLFWNHGAFAMFFLGITALIGAFLTKGVQEPFGFVYSFFFKEIPGFFLFRDPTKWYVLTTLSYSLLIPYSLYLLSVKFQQYKKIILVLFTLFWVVTLRFVFYGKVNGNLTPPKLTADYITFKNVLISDTKSGRVLWLPTSEKFSYQSELHPSLTAASIFTETSSSGIARIFREKQYQNIFQRLGISYIAVPEDIEKNIFLNNYVYDESLRNELLQILDTDTSLEKLPEFNRLAVYKTTDPTGLFLLNGEEIAMHFKQGKGEFYLPEREKISTFQALFTFDPYLEGRLNDQKIKPEKSANGMLSYTIPAGNSGSMVFQYVPDNSARIGAIISSVAFLSTVVLLLIKL